ncbi:MAG: ABC transporter ATP-binding protein [Actinomycetota bacterium]|nr:ABC transporter ATP-binding protein [Actinomycetota bacterium]
MTAISCRQAVVAFDGFEVLGGVDLEVPSGGWVTVVGPNGAGKSTLLRAVAGIVSAGGSVRLAGQPVDDLNRRELARLVAFVSQEPVIPSGMRVVDYVLLGRTAHLGFFEPEREQDLIVVSDALDALDARHLAARVVDTLSGGERQRIVIARALAQESPVLLLDEPTTALDIGHQQETLELIDRLRVERTLTVLATMHDLTLAGQYADRLVMLVAGLVVADGPATVVLTAEAVAQHYRARVRVVDDPAGPIVVLVPGADPG